MMWVRACGVDDIDPEDLIRFDHGGATYAIYRDPKGAFFATAGLCSHEAVHLCDGLVMGDLVECPKHNGRFNYKTGEAKGARLFGPPAGTRPKTYSAAIATGAEPPPNDQWVKVVGTYVTGTGAGGRTAPEVTVEDITPITAPRNQYR